MKKNATEASKSQPCHNCGGTSYCLNYPDRGSNCYRADNPDKKDKQGALYRYCPPASGPRRREESQNVVDPSPELATHDQLDRFYRELQLQLTLNPKHKEALRNRGLSDEAIQAYGLRSTPARGTLNKVADHLFRLFSAFYQNVPGAYLRENGTPALAIPVGTAIFGTNLEGRITQVQFRLDRANASDSRYRLFSSKSEKDGRPGPSPKVEPYLVQPVTVKPQESVLRICEGFFKAAVAAERTGITAIAAPSVGSLSSLKVYAGLKALKSSKVLLPLDQTAYWKPAVTRQVKSVLADYRKWSKDLGFTVMVETWGAGQPPQNRPDGIDDALAAGLEVIEISLEECEGLLPSEKGEAKALEAKPPTVSVNGTSGQVVERIIEAVRVINEEQFRVFTDEATGRIGELRNSQPVYYPTHDALANLLDGRLGIRFERTNSEGSVFAVDPPEKSLKRYLAMNAEDRRTPALSEIIECPALDPCGKLILTPGLQPGTGIFFDNRLSIPEVPADPNSETVLQCVREIDFTLGDFPFQTNHDRQAAWGLLLSYALRFYEPGPRPMHVVSAAQQGAGKGLLVGIPSLVFTGKNPPVLSLDPSMKNEECRKTLTSFLMSSPGPLINIDNFRGNFAFSAIEAFLTADYWVDRILGGNSIGTWQVKTLLTMTANNPSFSRDMERRLCEIRLDPPDDRPWTRNDFAITDLKGYLLEHRPRLLWCIAVLCARWVALGRPKGAYRIGSFEKWSLNISGLLDSIGVGSDYLGRSRADVSDTFDPWQTFAQLWLDSPLPRKEQKASDLCKFIGDSGVTVSETSPAHSLGRRMAKQVDRVFRLSYRGRAGVRFRLVHKPAGNNSTWSLLEVENESRNDNPPRFSHLDLPENPANPAEPFAEGISGGGVLPGFPEDNQGFPDADPIQLKGVRV